MFDTRMRRALDGAQLQRWLNVFGQVNLPHSIYHDAENRLGLFLEFSYLCRF
jgi:hypothetical protein